MATGGESECAFDLVAPAQGEVVEGRCAGDCAAEQFDARWRAAARGIPVRVRIAVAKLERAAGKQVRPAGLEEIEMIGFALALETAGQGKLRHHAAAGQRFETGGRTPIGKAEGRTAVKRLELIARGGADAAARVPVQDTAVLEASGRGQGDGLGGPLAGG